MSYSTIKNLTDDEKKTFAQVVENTADYYKYDYGDYAAAKGYFLSDRDMIYWGERYKKHEPDTDEEREWIENLFEACDEDKKFEDMRLGLDDVYFNKIFNDLSYLHTDDALNDSAEAFETAKNFEKGDIRDYLRLCGGKPSGSSEIVWLARHEHGTADQKKWINNMIALADEDKTELFPEPGDRDASESYYEAYDDITENDLVDYDIPSDIEINAEAVVREIPGHTFFKMPNGGDYDGYIYSLPNEKFKKYDNETIVLEPEYGDEDEIIIKHPDKPSRALPLQVFAKAVSGKTAKDYIYDSTMRGYREELKKSDDGFAK